MHATLTAASPYFAAASLAAHSERPATLPAGASPMHSTDALDSRDLLQGRKTITIAHNGTLYRLQATRLGKLILTK
jgi:hemin uptake protein HemP